MSASIVLGLMQCKVKSLQSIKAGDRDVNKVCRAVGMPPLTAASYALWPRGVETLLKLGAKRGVASTFGGYAVMGVVLGVADRLQSNVEPPSEVLKRGTAVLSVLLPVGMQGPCVLPKDLHPNVLLSMAEDAKRRKAPGLAAYLYASAACGHL